MRRPVPSRKIESQSRIGGREGGQAIDIINVTFSKEESK